MSEWRGAFLKVLSERGNVSEAARKAGITRGNAYHFRAEDPEFAAAWDEAKETAVDRLEEIAFRRAEKQSDALMTLLLKSLRPEVYRETVRQEHTGKDGDPLTITYVNDWRPTSRPEPEREAPGD
jgi:hypothetical protein